MKYLIQESKKNKGFVIGPEYQVLDDKQHPDAKLYTTYPGSRTVSSLYDIIPAKNKRFNGVGQWNKGVIKVFPNKHVEHWMNGFKTVEYDWASDAFLEVVKEANSRRRNMPNLDLSVLLKKVISFCRITGTKFLSGISR